MVREMTWPTTLEVQDPRNNSFNSQSTCRILCTSFAYVEDPVLRPAVNSFVEFAVWGSSLRAELGFKGSGYEVCQRSYQKHGYQCRPPPGSVANVAAYCLLAKAAT